MNIEQIRQEREKAEKQIMQVLTDFKEKTGMGVTDVNMTIVETWQVGKANFDVIVTGVKLVVERI